MKKLYSLLALVFVSTLSFTQENWCGTDAHLKEQEAEQPGLSEAVRHQIIRAVQSEITSSGDRSAPYVIPLVFHILHEGGEENISYEQILSAVDQLNEDFNRLNDDASDTRNTANAPFEPIAADFQISFELAKLDPNGDCTNGVERKYAPGATNNADDDAKKESTGGLTAWNRNDYFNIWVVKSIAGSGGGVTLGYAEFPYFHTSNFGVIIRSDVVGTIGTSSGDRTLTHEVGHCLGLLHTFQGGCHSGPCDENGDFVCDTPPVDEAHWSCVSSQNNCPEPSGDFFGFDAYDQWENYMSYAPCQNMFSEGQKDLVHFNMTDISMFENLTDPANLADAGVGLPDVLCKADFSASQTTVCTGNPINFFDASYSNVTSWNWTFEGGSPASSTVMNPSVSWSSGGTYDVTLEVSDGSSTVEVTFEDFITVLDGPGKAIPYKEGFESFSEIPDNENFMILNQDGDRTWELLEDPIPAYGGNNCVWIDNHAEMNGDDDELISGTIDLSGIDPSDDLVFSFYYSYLKRQPTNNESLRLFVSQDCGETWALRKNISGNNLAEENVFYPWEPETQEDWNYVEVTNINDDYWVENFRYKLVWKNDGGNNIYIDNINIYPASMTGIADPSKANHLKLFPNPATEEFSIELYSEEGQDYEIELYDALGKKVSTIYNGNPGGGFQRINYDGSMLPNGVYVVKVSSLETSQTLKLIIE